MGTKKKKNTATKTGKPESKGPTMGIPWGRGARPAKARKTATGSKVPAAPAPADEPGVLVRIDDGIPSFNEEVFDEKTAIRRAQQERLAFDTTAKITKLHQDYGAEHLELTDGTKERLAAIVLAPNLMIATDHADKAVRKAEVHVYANWDRIGGPDTPDTERAEKLRAAAKAPRAARARRDGPRDPRLPPPGTELSRERKGQTYTCKVLERGFEFNAKTYSSLSAISNEITGTSTNGLLWWGLIKRQAA